GARRRAARGLLGPLHRGVGRRAVQPSGAGGGRPPGARRLGRWPAGLPGRGSHPGGRAVSGAVAPAVDPTVMAQVETRWRQVQRRLERAGGAGVRVVAVTKGHGTWAVEAARRLGLLDVGENYAQELVEK